MTSTLEHAPAGECAAWGIPFTIGTMLVIKDQTVSVQFEPTVAEWFVFMHTSDRRSVEFGPDGFFSPMRGEGQLAEHAADYVMLYENDAEERVAIRQRHQIGAFQRRWGENCFEAVAHRKPRPTRAPHEQLNPAWGWLQTRVNVADEGPWVN